jgi:hypothetical protein
MRRIRILLVAAVAVAALSAAGAGAAPAATLTVDHPCYYSFGGAHQSIHVVGAGFAPNAPVGLTLAGQPYHSTASATGGFSGSIAAPAFRGARARVALTANDGRNTAGATFYLTNVTGDFNPSSGAPSRLRVRFTIAGLGAVLGFLHRDPHGTVFAHYIRPNGKLKGTRQFGHLTGPCGDLRTSRTRLLPFTSELGAWKIYLDTNRSYKRHELAQLLVGFKVRRISISR